MEDWVWGEDARLEIALSEATEFLKVSPEWEIGKIGAADMYPWGVVHGDSGGLALAYSLSEPRIARVVANMDTRQFYVAFDLGLTAETANFPSRAWVNAVLDGEFIDSVQASTFRLLLDHRRSNWAVATEPLTFSMRGLTTPSAHRRFSQALRTCFGSRLNYTTLASCSWATPCSKISLGGQMCSTTWVRKPIGCMGTPTPLEPTFDSIIVVRCRGRSPIAS
jgi:hypothetical protein